MPYAVPNAVSRSTWSRGSPPTMAPMRAAVANSDAVLPSIDE